MSAHCFFITELTVQRLKRNSPRLQHALHTSVSLAYVWLFKPGVATHMLLLPLPFVLVVLASFVSVVVARVVVCVTVCLCVSLCLCVSV